MKQTNISVDVNLLTMEQIHRVLWEVFPVPVDLDGGAHNRRSGFSLSRQNGVFVFFVL